MAEKRSRTFSVYLLKTDFNDPEKALRADHGLQPMAADKLPKLAKLYVLDTEPKSPWWKVYFGIKQPLTQTQKGALIFLPIDGRLFALTFGHVQHHLNEEAYEYDFGLRVTLNSVDPRELKSADMVSPGAARRKRTQVPTSTELTYLDFDGNSEIIKSLTGKVQAKYRDLFKNATGAVALKVTLKIEPHELADRCKKLLELYAKDDFIETFPNIQNILPIKDPSKKASLDAQLVEAVQKQSAHLNLSIPEIIDFRDNTCCAFVHSGKWSQIFPEIAIENFYQHLDDEDFDLDQLTLEFLRKCRVMLCDSDGEAAGGHSLYRSLIFDVEDPGEKVIYHLCDGEWYKAQTDFVERLKTYLDAKCVPTVLPPYNHDAIDKGRSVYSEERYNTAVRDSDGRYILLDQKNISPSGNTGVEPCDLYFVEDDDSQPPKPRAVLYHLKISTRSTYLSHLFNQGLNSVELLKGQPESRELLRKLVVDGVGANDLARYAAPAISAHVRVVFAIVTHKDEARKSDNLPLFSKISLMRNMMRLDIMTVSSSLMFVRDESPTKHGFAKHRRITAHVVVNAAGKKELRALAGQGVDHKQAIKRAPKSLTDNQPGDKFSVTVRLHDDGTLSTYHKWPFDPIL